MTQQTELIARLSEYERGDATDVVWKAANAIEALEAEVVRLTAENSAKMATCRGIIQGLEAELSTARAWLKAADEASEQREAQLAAAQQDLIEVMCARIKAADDAMADCDYMLDSADCISVIRGTWKHPMLNDKPAAPIPQQPAEPAPAVVLWRAK